MVDDVILWEEGEQLPNLALSEAIFNIFSPFSASYGEPLAALKCLIWGLHTSHVDKILQSSLHVTLAPVIQLVIHCCPYFCCRLAGGITLTPSITPLWCLHRQWGESRSLSFFFTGPTLLHSGHLNYICQKRNHLWQQHKSLTARCSDCNVMFPAVTTKVVSMAHLNFSFLQQSAAAPD